MATVNSKIEARRAVRKAQAQAIAARAKRERQNIDDTASLMMTQGRLGAIDDWESERIDQVRAEGQRRRQEQRAKAADAVRRLRERGESLQSIAALANTTVAELRALSAAVRSAAAAAATVSAAKESPAPHALGTEADDEAPNR
jgi:hypothetical protein